MKLALLMGNRFSAWHLEAFKRLQGMHEVVCFRAESEIQKYFGERDGGRLDFPIERIYFDYQRGTPPARWLNTMTLRYRGREPRILPFHERLRGMDAVLTWELFTDWTREALEARARYGTPVHIMVWDNIPFNNEQTPERRAIKQRAIETADRFWVYTERSRRMLLLEGVCEERIVRVNPGVDTELFAPGERDRAASGLPEDALTLLFVGWFLPRKGLDFLLYALRGLRDDPALAGRDIRLLMVGSGPGRDRIEALIARLNLQDSCHFAGSLPYDRMPQAFRAADLFVLPSIAEPGWQEQFGMSLIEAMSCGVPCVSTFSGAIPEILGGAGVLCQPNDFLALHAAIKGLLLDPAARMALGRVARMRAREEFGLAAQAQAFERGLFQQTSP